MGSSCILFLLLRSSCPGFRPLPVFCFCCFEALVLAFGDFLYFFFVASKLLSWLSASSCILFLLLRSSCPGFWAVPVFFFCCFEAPVLAFDQFLYFVFVATKLLSWLSATSCILFLLLRRFCPGIRRLPVFFFCCFEAPILAFGDFLYFFFVASKLLSWLSASFCILFLLLRSSCPGFWAVPVFFFCCFEAPILAFGDFLYFFFVASKLLSWLSASSCILFLLLRNSCPGFRPLFVFCFQYFEAPVLAFVHFLYFVFVASKLLSWLSASSCIFFRCFEALVLAFGFFLYFIFFASKLLSWVSASSCILFLLLRSSCPSFQPVPVFCFCCFEALVLAFGQFLYFVFVASKLLSWLSSTSSILFSLLQSSYPSFRPVPVFCFCCFEALVLAFGHFLYFVFVASKLLSWLSSTSYIFFLLLQSSCPGFRPVPVFCFRCFEALVLAFGQFLYFVFVASKLLSWLSASSCILFLLLRSSCPGFQPVLVFCFRCFEAPVLTFSHFLYFFFVASKLLFCLSATSCVFFLLLQSSYPGFRPVPVFFFRCFEAPVLAFNHFLDFVFVASKLLSWLSATSCIFFCCFEAPVLAFAQFLYFFFVASKLLSWLSATSCIFFLASKLMSWLSALPGFFCRCFEAHCNRPVGCFSLQLKLRTVRMISTLSPTLLRRTRILKWIHTFRVAKELGHQVLLTIP